jgi:hypothetical protein
MGMKRKAEDMQERKVNSGKAVPWFRLLVAGFPPRRPGFEPRSIHVEFVVDKVALEQVSSQYFGFPCQFSFHRLLHTHHLSSGAGTLGQLVTDVPSGLSLTPPEETRLELKLTVGKLKSLKKCEMNINQNRG